MRKIKLFLEFVSGNKESLFIPLTYDDISKKFNCTIDEVEEFENWLDDNIKPGEIFHGSLGSEEDEMEKPVDMFDKIENEDDYIEMWKQYKSSGTGHSSHSHDEDGL
jgi:hypothetical protein